MDYSQTINYLYSFPDSERGLPGAKPIRGLKMPLATMEALLQKIGNPQNGTKTIHITGSKGKGSTATFITSILQKAGFRTALFTSPHLHSYEERIAFDLKPVSQKIFAEGVSYLKPFIDEFDEQGNIISTFGILTALFFYLVQEASPPVDWQIVEVGLGGKEDTTNVFEQKEIAVITPVSLEHTAILGNTRSAIAENKAGIITPGCAAILAPQNDTAVVEVVKNVCQKQGADFIDVGSRFVKNWSSDGDNSLGVEEISSLIKLPGEHQITNAMTAVTAIQALNKNGWNISLAAIKTGLAAAFIPGRFEIIDVNSGHNNFVCPIVLDGAHNGDSAEALAKTLKANFSNKKALFILGVVQDKNLEEIWAALNKFSDDQSEAIFTRSGNHRSMSPEEMQKRILACDAKAKIICTENIDAALKKAKEISEPENVICVCGSLYLVAEARERLMTI